LTVNKLIALANIYNIPAEQMLRSMYTGDPQPVLRQLSSPNGDDVVRREVRWKSSKISDSGYAYSRAAG
jgi:hypothetical protein